MNSSVSREEVLISIPFSVYPVQSGGALRAWHLLRELSRHFRVTAFVTSRADDVQRSILAEVPEATGTLEVLEIPNYERPGTLVGRLWHRLQTLWLTRDWRIATNGTQYALVDAIRRHVRSHSADIVISTNLESAPLARRIRQWLPNALSVLDLHNIESELYRRARAVDLKDCHYRVLVRQEMGLVRSADLVQVCSDEDGVLLQRICGSPLKWRTVPNGVATERISFDTSPEKSRSPQVLFCGTLSYRPNIEGLNWFCSQVWPLIRAKNSAAELVVVGRGYRAESFPGLLQLPGVKLVGEVVEVLPHYRESGVAVCPLLSGSGTRLKILEAMSAGNPVVSTAIGCEGLQLQDGCEILIRNEPQSFADGVVDLMGCEEQFHRLRLAARVTAESRYDWRVVGNDLSKILLQSLSESRRTE
jgi:glycosyltransferase involved in cell wall biosynthesis